MKVCIYVFIVILLYPLKEQGSSLNRASFLKNHIVFTVRKLKRYTIFILDISLILDIKRNY